jgi:DNA-binding beta-propeller fold protein YncE
VAVSGRPFGVATTTDGGWSFVDLIGGHVALFSDAGFAPRAVRTIALPRGADAVGNSLTRDGRYLLVADSGGGATVLSVARAEAGAEHAVLGTLAEPGRRRVVGAIEVASSPDGRYAFVSIEGGSELGGEAVAVYDLHAALDDGFRTSSYLGSVPLGRGVVGLAVSPDGRWLYATSEVAASSSPGGTGLLSVISLTDAERHPARALVASVPADCQPVRVAVSSDGTVVWVTARGSDQLLAFSARGLHSDPAQALLAAVRVGEAPVGLALIADGREVIVADRAQDGLTVVSAAAALAHRPAVLGTIPAGTQPREVALEPNGDTCWWATTAPTSSKPSTSPTSPETSIARAPAAACRASAERSPRPEPSREDHAAAGEPFEQRNDVVT